MGHVTLPPPPPQIVLRVLCVLVFLQESDLVRLRQLLKQRESEAAVLGRQLQGQTDELDDLRQNSTAGRENQRLLKQAAVDIVGVFSSSNIRTKNKTWVAETSRNNFLIGHLQSCYLDGHSTKLHEEWSVASCYFIVKNGSLL